MRSTWTAMLGILKLLKDPGGKSTLRPRRCRNCESDARNHEHLSGLDRWLGWMSNYCWQKKYTAVVLLHTISAQPTYNGTGMLGSIWALRSNVGTLSYVLSTS